MAARTTRNRARTAAVTGQNSLFSTTSPVPAFSDRPYQVDAVSSVTTGLADGGRGQLRSACGTGKTKMAQWSAERLVPHGGIVVIVAPTVGLVAQTLAAWNEGHDDHLALAVCSDSSVTDDSYGSTDDILESVTTDSNVIDAWLRRPTTAAIRLIVGTHASSHVIGEGLQKAMLAADLLVIDEAHRSSGWIGKQTALLHDDDVLPAIRRLYMTATARIYETSRGDSSTLSMDDESVFGPVLFSYPFSRAIEDGYLDDYRLAVIGVTRAEVLAVLRDTSHRGRSTTRLPSEHTAMVQAATARAAAELGLRRVIAFCPRVEDARQFAETFHSTIADLPEELRPRRRLHAAHIQGTMKQSRRREVLRTLAHPPHDGWTVISNAKCLSEGIDVPTVDGIAFTAPKNSTVDIVQAIGRALRRDPDGSGTATIIVPILLPDDSSTDEEQIDAGAFETLWQVVRGLRAHDDTFSTLLDSHRAKHFEGTSVQDQITFLMPEGHQSPAFLEHLTIRLVKGATSTWWDGYAHLVDFHAREGHCRVNHLHVTDSNFPLGKWVSSTRVTYRESRLGTDRVEALRKLGFIPDTRVEDWESAFAVAAEFYNHNGHLKPRTDFRSRGVRLFSWLERQRTAQARGTLQADRETRLTHIGMEWADPNSWADGLATIRAFHAANSYLPTGAPFSLLSGPLRKLRGAHTRGELSADLIAELEGLGIVWKTPAFDWWDGYAHLVEFHRERDHTLVKKDHVTGDGFHLGVWVNATRRYLRNNELTTPQADALTTLDFIVDLRSAAWESAFAVAAAFYAEKGHLRPASSYRNDGFDLRTWCVSQRTRRVRGTLSAEREARLTEIGMEWGDPSAWQKRLPELRAYHAEHGRLPTNRSYSPVSGAMAAVRAARKRAEITTDQIAELDEMGMDWAVPATNWWDGYAKLVAFHARHGHFRVPRDEDDDEFVLSTWVTSTRMTHGQQRLAPDQVEALEKIGFPFDAVTANWEYHFAVASAFFAEYGHLRPSSKTTYRDVNLRDWLSKQRRAFADGNLDDDRRARLDAIGMTWHTTTVWQARLDQLRDYHTEHGHLPTEGADPALDTALGKIRAAYKHNNLDTDIITALDDLGIEWTKPSNWWVGHAHLVAFHAREGHTFVDRDHITADGFPLGTWLSTAQYRRRRQELAPDRTAALEALGVAPDMRAAKWEHAYCVAAAFHAEYQHLRPAPDFVNHGVALADWLQDQRSARKRGKLDVELQARLNDIGLEWEPEVPHLDRLRAYHSQHGCLPTKDSGQKHYESVTALRAARRRDELDANTIAALDRLDMVWNAWVPDWKPVDWERGIAVATRFRARHGHFDVRTADPRDPDDPSFDLFAWVKKLRLARKSGKLTPAHRNTLDELGIVWSAHQASWEQGIAACAAYYAEYGHLRIPYDHAVTNQRGEPLRLGLWICKQRDNRTKLTLDQVAELDAIGMVWDAHNSKWEANLAALTAFHNKYGHLNIPADLTATTGTKVAAALSNYLTQYRKGTLPDDRVRALEAIGVDWEPARTSARDHMIDALRTYYAAHGDIFVPTEYCNDHGVNVFDWLYQQRIRHENGSLSATQTAELDELGMVWKKGRTRWVRTLSRLREHYAKHGDINITYKQGASDPEAAALRTLILRYRTDFDKGRLPQYKVDDLNRLGIDWRPANGHEEQWKTSFSHAEAFYREHGDLDVPSGHTASNGLRLDQWVSHQRSVQHQGKLSAERVTLLDSIGMTWRTNDQADAAWDNGIAAIERYRETVGPPSGIGQRYRTTHGFWLGAWIVRQRQALAKGTLAPERARRLAELGVVLVNEHKASRPKTPCAQRVDTEWATTYDDAAAFAEKHGHLNFSAADPTDPHIKTLAAWLKRQRKLHTDGQLAPDRKLLLANIGVDWRTKSERSWDEGMGHLRVYIATLGDPNQMPRSYSSPDGFKLRSWLERARKAAYAGDLPASWILELAGAGVRIGPGLGRGK